MTQPARTPGTPAGQALQRLLAGNSRFTGDEPTFLSRVDAPRWAARRHELVAGQKPFAAILACSDSRVVPEIIFDQGLGDLFVARVAGNIVDETLQASLEFAVHRLDVPLLVVLGHTGCGAVQLAVSGIRPPRSLAALVDAIEPAVAVARREPGDLVENTVRANVVLSVSRLEGIGGVEIVGAVYDLASGRVELL